MDVNVVIDLSKRTERALRDLCAALIAKQAGGLEPTATATEPATATPFPPAPIVAAATMPAAAEPATATPVPPAPVPAPAATPVPAATAAPAPAVPLSQAPTYTKAQVASAGAALIQADPSKRDSLVALLKRYGAPSVADLPEEHLGAFATELRALGADI